MEANSLTTEITQNSIYEPVTDELKMVITEVKNITRRSAKEKLYVDDGLGSRLNHVLATPGKRVRPALTLLTSKLWTDQLNEDAMSLATGVELLHIATLVHDDTVDHADTRRGHQTASKLWGRNVAVLIGDFIFATSAVYVCETKNISLMRRFAETITELSRGELNEIYTAWQMNVSLGDYKQRIYDKTASLFSTAAESGAVVGGGDNESINNLREYGYCIGMAYQVYDDLLDYTASSEDLGKPTGQDLRQGVITLPAIIAKEKGASEDIIRFIKSSENERETLLPDTIKAIKETGAIEETSQVAKKYIDRAINSLNDIPESVAKRSLISLAEYVQTRDY